MLNPIMLSRFGTITKNVLSNNPIKNITSRSLVVSPERVEDFTVKNEPCLSYLKGSKERTDLEAALAKYSNDCVDVPIIIGEEEIRTGTPKYQVMPFDHSKKIAKFYWATPEIVQKAVDHLLSVREEWEKVPLNDKIQMFLKAGDLVSTKYRMELNAATMLGQGKTIVQAEIDSAAELADFFRFNAYFAKELTKYQPISEDPKVTVNTFRYRGLEGFIAAISPFNFTAIGGNLSSAPTLMGNVVAWKPSDTAILSNYIIYKLMREAGFPPGVISFIPADGPVFGDVISSSPHLAGINFTGSVPTFQRLWKQTAEKLEIYKNFPRLVGECGGKNYHFIHPSADVPTVVAMTIRSAFEYSGQKCSACSRAYIPSNLWPEIKEGLLETLKQLKLGSPLEADTFLSSVIDERSFERISYYLHHAKSSSNLKVLGGGGADKSTGYFIQPTIVESSDPKDKIIQEEIFGPVLSLVVYPEKDTRQALQYVRECNYGLTGSVFSQDKSFAEFATNYLKMTAGNFYINDKSTGSVVGQQPFGGSRISGTNDKAGGPHYLLRWTSPQVIKETMVPLREWKYPYMSQ